MTENEFYVYLDGHNDRKEFELNIMRHIVWSGITETQLKRNKTPMDFWPLSMDKVVKKVKKFDLEEYKLIKSKIEKTWKAKKHT